MNKIKKLVMALLAGLIAGCGSCQQPAPTLKQGSKAPGFESIDQRGEPVQLAALLSEGPVVLTFLRSFY